MRLHVRAGVMLALSTARSVLAVVLTSSLALASFGCSPTFRSGGAEVTKGAVPAAVDTSLDKLQEPQTQQKLVAVTSSPEIKRAVMDLSAGITEGVGEGMGSDAMAANMERLMRQLARSFMLAMMESMRSLGPTMQKEIKDDLGPAIRTTMRDDIAPGLAGLFESPELQSSLGHATRAVAHEAVMGSNEALAELAEREKHDKGGQPMGTVASLFKGRSWILLAIGALLLLGLPLLWILWQMSTLRGYLQQQTGKSPRELRRELRANRSPRPA